jgi:hypothetical protein
MKNIIVPQNEICYTEISRLNERKPIGMLTTEKIKFLVVRVDERFTYNRIDNLNNSGFYCPASKYDSLQNLFKKEVSLGERFFLFDSWQEFYQWCAECLNSF